MTSLTDLGIPVDEVPPQPTRQSEKRHRRAARHTTPYKAPPALRGTWRGFAGRGGGRWNRLPEPAEYWASSNQVCGMWPFVTGSARPTVGAPLGFDMDSDSLVCCDPIEWFRAGFISNPSIMIFGLPGLGKSSVSERMIISCADRGIPPLIFGDLKPDYAELIGALGGVVIPLGPGLSQINPLDLGALSDAAATIGGADGADLLALAEQQAAALTIAIAQVVRRAPLQDFEETVLEAAVHLVRARNTAPQLVHLLELLEHGHEDLLVLSVSATLEDFHTAMQPLRRTLQAMTRGPMGQVFGGATSIPIPVNNPGGVCIDISGLESGDQRLLAAVMLATWAHGFAAVDAAWALHKAGHGPWNGFLTVQDEMWRPLRASSGLVDKLDALSRTNRAKGVGEIRITHSMKDADSLNTEEDRVKARGFAERAGMLGVMGLDRTDLIALSRSRPLSQKEINHCASWTTPEGWEPQVGGDGRTTPPPGAGKILLKVGGRAGLPVQVQLTGIERDLHDTNQRWKAETSA